MNRNLGKAAAPEATASTIVPGNFISGNLNGLVRNQVKIHGGPITRPEAAAIVGGSIIHHVDIGQIDVRMPA